MASSVQVPVEEYLRTAYRPDCDYVDGEIVERNMGEREHSTLQREILLFLAARYPDLRKRVFPEQRLQVSASRFRVPDICVLKAGAPYEKVVRTAPELCIEILSPEDRLNRTLERFRDYFGLGVSICWMIDPETRRAWVARPGHLDEVLDGVLRAGEIEMPLADVFEGI